MTWIEHEDVKPLVHLVGRFPNRKYIGGRNFEVLYDPATTTGLDDVEMHGAASYLLEASYPPGSVVRAPGFPPMMVDVADPTSIWAVFAYNGAIFEVEEGIARTPAPIREDVDPRMAF